jgi:O-antigen/teichoic acid export membrane protein
MPSWVLTSFGKSKGLKYRSMLPRLRHNIAALGVLQVANYVIPLVTLPFLARVLGPTAFGKLAFVQVLMTFFNIVTDYGYSLGATLQISANRSDRARVTAIFNATWWAQWTVLAGCMAVIAVLVAVIPVLRVDAPLHAMGVLLVIANVLFPIWLLQGLERMREVAVIQIVGRLLPIPLMFMFIHGPGDALVAVALVALGPLLAGLISMLWIRFHEVVDFRRPTLDAVRSALCAGAGLCISKLTISSYTTLVPFVLGTVSGPVPLASFNLADRLRTSAQSSLTPILQALFPRMGHLYSSDARAATSLLKVSLVAVLVLGGGASAVLWIFADPIISLIGGDSYRSSVSVLRYIAALPLIISVSSIASLQILLPNNRQVQFNRGLRLGSLLAVIMVWPMCAAFGEIGAALVWLIVESFICLYMWYGAVGVLRSGRAGEYPAAAADPIGKIPSD